MNILEEVKKPLTQEEADDIEVIGEIREHEDGSNNCYYTADDLEPLFRSHALLIARIEELEGERRWVPIGERLPKKFPTSYFSENVTCFRKGVQPFTGYFDYQDGTWRDLDDCCITGAVTHWMPLPQKPE